METMVESAQHKPSPAVALIDPVTQGEAPAVPQALLKLRSKRSTQPADSDDRPESEVGFDAGLSLDDAQLAVPEAGPILAVQAQADVAGHVPNAAAVGEASAASGAGAAQAPAAAVTGLGFGGDIAALGLAAAASLNAVSVASNGPDNAAPAFIAAHDATSRDGRANQPDATKIQTQWMDQVTGTDIVSDAEYRTGFTITGHASAGAQSTIQFRLDKDRTDGVVGADAQVLTVGSNDVDNDGTPDVTVAYDNATGDWSMTFAPNSHALLQATHNTSGSGVHQLLVDTDGDGSRTGSGATAEASRLFLVADGTASSADTGTVAQNYSVQDQITGDVFVYYYGDPDGTGIGLWTLLDNGDSANDPTVVTTDQDQSTTHSSDWDYYNNPTDNAAGTPATTSNTALHLVTNIAAQTWEFHAASNGLNQDWDVANAQAKDHNVFGSNSSRQISLVEAMALYAANFGGDSPGGNTVGAVQPMSNAGSTNGYVASEDNHPQGWGFVIWTAAPTPSGHAILYLNFGDLSDLPDANEYLVAAVL